MARKDRGEQERAGGESEGYQCSKASGEEAEMAPAFGAVFSLDIDIKKKIYFIFGSSEYRQRPAKSASVGKVRPDAGSTSAERANFRFHFAFAV